MQVDPIDFFGNFKNSTSYCGCFAKIKEKSSSEETLPLTKSTYQINIINGLSEVTLIQEYKNFTQQFLEISYKFPISPNVCLHKFSATFSSKRMEGRVKEREEAKQQYNQAVKQGKKAALGAVDKQTKDLMTISIGNVQPNQKVTIEISYIQELSISLNTFYRFSLPVKNSPRYQNSISQVDFQESFRSQRIIQGKQFVWDFHLRLRSSRKILSFDSFSHKIAVESTNDSQTDISLTFEKGCDLSKDFVFTYATTDFQLPSYSLGRTDAGSSVMVSFIPKFCDLSLQDAKVQALKSQHFESNMDSARGEYIFLLDRSGSMGGNRINKAKTALMLFLKSLPVDSYFNVVSFGSHYQKMSPEPMRSGTQIINSAVSKVQCMSADLGGTQIEKPLKNILESQVIKGYPKQIYLLTDGEVTNTQSVIELVRKNIKYSRVHGIGIGDGASEALIKGCSEKGKGYHIFIKDHQNPSQKIIQLLNDSLTPVISQVKLQFDKSVVESIIPNPESMPYILKGEVANFYIMFRGQLQKPTSIAFQYKDTSNNLPYRSEISIQPESPSQLFIDKMARFRSIKVLQDAENEDLQDFMYYVKVVDKKKEIIEQSTKYQVLSKYTAFVCVQQVLVDGKYQEVKDKGQLAVQINIEQKQKPIQQKDVDFSSFFGTTTSSVTYSSPSQQNKRTFNNLFGIGSASSSSGYSLNQLQPPPPPPPLPHPQLQPQSQKMSLNDCFDFFSAPLPRPPPIPPHPIQNLPSSPPPAKPQAPPSPLKSSEPAFDLLGFSSQPQSYLKFSMRPPPEHSQVTFGSGKGSIQNNLFGGMGLSGSHHHPPPPPPPPGAMPSLFGQPKLQPAPGVNLDTNFDDFSKKRAEDPFAFLAQSKKQQQKTFDFLSFTPPSKTYTIKELVSLQNFQGYWSSLDIVASLLGQKAADEISAQADVTAVVTYLIVKWIEKHHPEADYMLIRKKATTWLKKQSRYNDFPALFDRLLV